MAPDMNRHALGALLLAALALRIAAAVNTHVINHDGARYTAGARAIQRGDWNEALHIEPRMPPLFPIAIAGLAPVAGGTGLAGVLISILFGTLAAIPIYLLAREAFPRATALLSALLLAILPAWVSLASDVWTEPLFLCLLFSSFAATWFAGERPALWKYAIAGLFGGLAVLTRPEGIYAAAAIAGWGAIAAIVHRGERDRLPLRVAGPLLSLALFAVLLYPYSRWIRNELGIWSFTPNQFAAQLLGGPEVEKNFWEDFDLDPKEFEGGRDESRFGRVPGKIFHALKNYHRVNGYVLLPFLLVGFFVMNRSRRPGTALPFLLVLAAGYAIPTWVGLFVGVPFGERYILPSFLILAPVTAAGLLWAWDRISRSWNPERARKIGIAALALLAVGSSVSSVRPHAMKRRTLADAGRWIRGEFGPGSTILSMDRRVEHYAEARAERVPAKFARLKELVAARRPAVIVLYESYLHRHEPGFERAVAEAWPLVHAIPEGKRGAAVRIYRVNAPP